MAQLVNVLGSPIEFLKGVGPQRADILKKELGIFTFGDLLQHFPYRYIDRTAFHKINQLNPNTQNIQLTGKVVETSVEGAGANKRFKAYFTDGTGEVTLVWFRGLKWITGTVKSGNQYMIFGKPNIFRGEYSFIHPEISPLEEIKEAALNTGRLQPMYASTEKLKSTWLNSSGIEKLMKMLFNSVREKDVEENLPDDMLRRFHFPSRFAAYKQVHFPTDDKELESARNRLKFEELFFTQLRLLRLKLVRQNQSRGFIFKNLDPYFNQFYKEQLPFALTAAQKRVIKEIRADILSGKQMNRLLQGDVGSGKTIVALLCMMMALSNGFQSCLMVPTEILAQQHFRTISKLVGASGIRVGLLTASVKGAERKKLLEQLKEGKIQMLIGTHALIEDQVVFQNLGLVVIDEQHRFGVEQRGALWTKNQQSPHILVMTATPIPRTLAMTVYGDLDVSVIDELPPGRKPVTTVHRNDAARLRVFGFMKEEIKKGRQVYVVYPLIEESEKQDYKFLMDGYESIARAFPLPEYAVSIVHGQMKTNAREYEMQRFLKGETQIMISTTVIEVGVDVPNASLMVIESAERFGLSQLHQLRGRVGRGADQSFCILMTGDKVSQEARQRIRIMCETNDGFRIAEEDLKLRGPGDIEGTQQSGLVQLKIADLIRDQKILLLAREEAIRILQADAALQQEKNKVVKNYLEVMNKKYKKWSAVS